MSGWGKGKGGAAAVKYQKQPPKSKVPDSPKVPAERQDIKLDPTSSVLYIPNFLTQPQADEMLQHLLNNIPWRKVIREVKGGDKSYELPRLQCWMSDPFVKADLYQKEPALEWDLVVGGLRVELETLLNCKFDYVLMNHYRDGNDFIGFHRDDEADQPGKNVIASLSLGSTRDFVIKHRSDQHNKNAYTFALAHGALVVMMGDTQIDWRHGVPKDPSVTTPRINLTFRKS